MAHTHTCLLYHFVFSTKGRRPWIDPQTLPRLAKFMGGVVRKRQGKLLAMNGTENHVHVLVGLPPKISVSDQVGVYAGQVSLGIRSPVHRHPAEASQEEDIRGGIG